MSTEETFFCIFCNQRFAAKDLLTHPHGTDGLSKDQRKRFEKHEGKGQQVARWQK